MLAQYFENVAFQFYNKVEEVDYFLQTSIANHEAYKSKPTPRPAGHIAIAQHNFSAFISALYATWEIVKLTHDLAKEVDGVPPDTKGEWLLKSQAHPFTQYFKGSTPQDFQLYQFLQQARHATNHDGSMALNGGIEDEFCFFGPIDRFEPQRLPKANSKFQRIVTRAPDMIAIRTMRQLAIRLLPLFEQKLRRPAQFSNPLMAKLWTRRAKGVQEFIAKYAKPETD